MDSKYQDIYLEKYDIKSMKSETIFTYRMIAIKEMKDLGKAFRIIYYNPLYEREEIILIPKLPYIKLIIE